MAKVTSPLFDSFYEAFSNVLVFQRSVGSNIIARKKVRHPTEKSSAHLPNRVPGWTKAINAYRQNQYPGKSLTDLIADFALSPDSPKNLMCRSINSVDGETGQYEISLTWSPVETKYNGWPLTNLEGYRVHFSSDAVSWEMLNDNPIVQTGFVHQRPPGSWLYFVTAIDSENHFSHESNVIEVIVS